MRGFVEVKAKAEMRETYKRILALPGLSQRSIGMLSDAAARVGMAVFDEFEEVNLHRRSKGGKKHGKTVKTNTEAKHDVRWLNHLEALMKANRNLTDHEIARRIVVEKEAATKSEMRTVYRYVQARRPTLSCSTEK